jgi:hypothetical protein
MIGVIKLRKMRWVGYDSTDGERVEKFVQNFNLIAEMDETSWETWT